MLISMLQKVFGSKNDRILKKFSKIVAEINALENTISRLNEKQLKVKTIEFKERYKNGESLDELLPEAFATVREVAQRNLNMRHFDVQLIGGIALHKGKITEMRTGEGKTLVATLPAYLNSLTGDGVHIVTVNDYLVKRDAAWMKPIYDALGLTVGTITSEGMSKEDKIIAYKADIIYGTNNEFGFDYLRDNMAFDKSDLVQGKLSYAIIDEVDSVLIDEARTPLIISGANNESTDLYKKINNLIKNLILNIDFTIDEKAKQILLTENGHEKIELILVKENLLNNGYGLYETVNINLMHHIISALKANFLFKRDVDYLIKNQEVIIIDEHTGRAMVGRRWSDGIHQAIEAKENVPIQPESHTLASITFQNYFRLYDKLSGMTGTADTEAYELDQIYNLEVVVIPTNVPCKRKDLPDVIYMTAKEKYQAILEDIIVCVERKQPVLVGTSSIENSELLSRLLNTKNIAHQVLNAKFHAKEAEIIAEAGRPGAVTIATNMAGRGTDIVLGGNLKAELSKLDPNEHQQIEKLKEAWKNRHNEVIALGGLKVIGSERHESRRIDNQLRGRTGRQGDPGLTKFYLSLEDNLMRIFISNTISGILGKLGLEKGEAITHPLITKAVENAQKKVEGHNFEIRKQLLEFDDVANDQRSIIYQQRAELIISNDCSEMINIIKQQELEKIITEFIPKDGLLEEWNVEGLEEYFSKKLHHNIPISKWLVEDNHLSENDLKNKICNIFEGTFNEKEQIIGATNMRHLEKIIMLQVLDNYWKEHLATMDYLRQSIHLRGYAQKDPKQEYKREAFDLFKMMLGTIRKEVFEILICIDVKSHKQNDFLDKAALDTAGTVALEYRHDAILDSNVFGNIGRNSLCPCNSGKKYKHCHGELQ